VYQVAERSNMMCAELLQQRLACSEIASFANYRLTKFTDEFLVITVLLHATGSVSAIQKLLANIKK